jgi:hypothetical protein
MISVTKRAPATLMGTRQAHYGPQVLAAKAG